MRKIISIRIYGSGCIKCNTLERRVKRVVTQLNLESEYKIEKITDYIQMLDAGVTAVPALEINGDVKSKGRLLSEEEIRLLLIS
ncbi:MAG: thioredoxin family protein [Candidatus Hodarchaeota archaeon]